jgi:hypothetical protein
MDPIILKISMLKIFIRSYIHVGYFRDERTGSNFEFFNQFNHVLWAKVSKKLTYFVKMKKLAPRSLKLGNANIF